MSCIDTAVAILRNYLKTEKRVGGGATAGSIVAQRCAYIELLTKLKRLCLSDDESVVASIKGRNKKIL